MVSRRTGVTYVLMATLAMLCRLADLHWQLRLRERRLSKTPDIVSTVVKVIILPSNVNPPGL
jgi:hypothetical protein